MGLVGLYRRIGTISNRWAKFPRDYELIEQSKIDDEFDGHPEIMKRRWLCLENKNSRTKYAFAYDLIDGKYKQVMLHRLVWSLKHGPIDKDTEIDHKNHNGLDNQIENLRPASHHANTCNARLQSNAKTGYKGVDAGKARQSLGGYGAYVCPHGKKSNVGFYSTIQEAAFARDVAATFLYGEFCTLNNVSDEDVPEWRRNEIRAKVLGHLAKHNLTTNILASA